MPSCSSFACSLSLADVLLRCAWLICWYTDTVLMSLCPATPQTQ
ncbi:hypothetical protein HMPREF1583_01010 [Gardnerella vaginalis JCP8151B]|nr:hypothetical protein HMPREF1583_01010 [Gardnerella vaginalis JCP8151B]